MRANRARIRSAMAERNMFVGEDGRGELAG
jgi:hypothetical protein